jgi:hypothetical protein
VPVSKYSQPHNRAMLAPIARLGNATVLKRSVEPSPQRAVHPNQSGADQHQ